MGSINQKKALKFLEEMLKSLESTTQERGIEANPNGLLILLYMERVADYLGSYPDTPATEHKANSKRSKNYERLESLRSRIATLAERVPEERRTQILKEFNDTTAVTTMIKGSTSSEGPADDRSSKEFVNDWLDKHPREESE